ncbi:MAG: hypothetical protein AAF362_14245 [Pseudomonadota bacterium]
MKSKTSFLFAAGIAAVLSSVMAAGPAFAKCSTFKPTRPGEVYLIRGLANVFSLGMDTMAKEFTKLGIQNCVANHRVWTGLAQDVIERNYSNAVNYPVIIVGHSLGAGVAPKMATRLGKNNIEVAYVVMYDPVEPTQVGKNVDEIINYYLNSKNKDKILRPGAGFEGDLQNIDLRGQGNVDHFNIEDNRQLQQIVYDRAMALSNAIAEKEG